MERKLVDINESIDKLELSLRTKNCLKRKKLETIIDVINFANTKGLCSVRSLGDKSIQEIEKSILDKCNILIIKNGYAELRTLNLSSRALNILIKKYNVTTIDEVLNLCINSKYSLKYLKSSIKSEKEIIDKVHELGYTFRDEQEIFFKLDDDVSKLNFPYLRFLKYYGIHTIRDLLKLSLNKHISRKEKGIYNIRGLGDKRVEELITLVHSIGFKFDCEIASKVEEFRNEFNDSDIGYDIYNFMYGDRHENIFWTSKKVDDGSRVYEFNFSEPLKKYFLESFEQELSIYHMNFELFIYNEFRKYLNSLNFHTVDIVRININKIFKNYEFMDGKSTSLNDEIFSTFKLILSKEYVKNYIFEVLNPKKSNLMRNKHYVELVNLLDRILLFIRLERMELIQEHNLVDLDKLNIVKQQVFEIKENLDSLIINYYFDLDKIDAQLDDYVMDFIYEIIENLQDKYHFDIKKVEIPVDLDTVFHLLPEELITMEFYDKVSSMDEQITNNRFFIDFVRLASEVCSKEDGSRYEIEELIIFLKSKFENKGDKINYTMENSGNLQDEQLDIYKLIRKL